ncbi:MAG: YbhB/YbcL family Raf kinase inhibitor-like protein [bacterium]
MTLESPAFKNGEILPSKFTCDGQDTSPPLMISGVPVGAQSLALIVDDPDAVRGVWTHWLVWNIAPTTSLISENSTPQGGVEGTTSFGSARYGGPCPPFGIHRYRFKIIALDIKLGLGAESDVKALEAVMKDHILETAELVGLYGRK